MTPYCNRSVLGDQESTQEMSYFVLIASDAIRSGEVVVSSGPGTVAPSVGVSALVLGVALDAATPGGRATVIPLEGGLFEVTAAGVIAAGAGVESAADGRVATASAGLAGASAAGTLVGIAIDEAAVAGQSIRILGRR